MSENTQGISDGGSAFPRLKKFYKSENAGERSAYLHYLVENDEGMSLRDFFAAHALNAIVSKHQARIIPKGAAPATAEEMARGAYAYADAMLACRSVRP